MMSDLRLSLEKYIRVWYKIAFQKCFSCGKELTPWQSVHVIWDRRESALIRYCVVKGLDKWNSLRYSE